jgi:hypothetical protein
MSMPYHVQFVRVLGFCGSRLGVHGVLGGSERSRRLWLQLASPEAWAVLGSGEPAGG